MMRVCVPLLVSWKAFTNASSQTNVFGLPVTKSGDIIRAAAGMNLQ